MTREPNLLRASELFGEAERLYHDAADALRRAATAFPCDDNQHRVLEGLLDTARRNEQRLTEIHGSIDALAAGVAQGVLATVRTLANQVNVYRKHLVAMRGVENPFLLLPSARSDGSGSDAWTWEQ
jgi:hypothetical protein